MFKMIKLLAVLLCLTTTFKSSFCQTFHALVFAVTEDSEIGEGAQVSFKLLTEEINTIVQLTGMTLNRHYFTGQDVSLNNLNQTLRDLDSGADDVLLFYFVGHGFADPNRPLQYPNLLFRPDSKLTKADLTKNARNLEMIYDELVENKTYRMALVIGEACNDDYLFSTMGPNSVIGQTDMKDKRDQAQYVRLFLNERGEAIIASSKRGQKSYISKKKGGIFTQAFVNAIQEVGQKGNDATFDNLIDQVYLENKKITDEITNVTPPEPVTNQNLSFFQKVMQIFVDRKDKKKIKKATKNGKFEYYEEIFDSRESREYYLEKKPFSYYVVKSIASEARLNSTSNFSDTVEVFLDYCTADAFYKELKIKDRDKGIVEKIEKENRKHSDRLKIEAAGGMAKWLGTKCTECQAYLESQKGQIGNAVEALEVEKRRLETQIDQDQDRLIELDQSQEEREAELIAATTKITRNNDFIANEVGVASFQMPALPSNISTIEKLKEVERGKDPSDLQLNADERLWLSEVVIKNEANTAMAPNVDREADLKGFSIGKWCSPQIQEAATATMKLLLRQIEFVPDTFRSELGIKLKVEGFADWRSAGRNLSIPFTAQQDLNLSYFDKFQNLIAFQLRAGNRIQITNEQLAFLRALCAFETAVELLQAEGITNLVDSTFHAIEQDEPQTEEEKQGDQFRGVNVFFEIENIFGFLIDENEKLAGEQRRLRREIDRIQREIRRLEEQIEENEGLIGEIIQKIRGLENRIAEIDQAIKDAQFSDTEAYESEVERRVKEVQNIKK